MAAFGLILVVFLPAALVSTAAACWPLRSTRRRVGVLSGHVLASVLLIAALDGPWQLWAMVFGPGLLVALARLANTVPARQ